MLIMSTIILLISNALNHIRELTILFSRSIMYLLFIISILTMDNFNLIFLSKGISIYSGLFFVKPYLETFSFFIYLITALILLLTSYYPRSFLNPVKSQENVSIEKAMKNENLEQYKIIEYSLLILFVLNGAILLMASDDLVSILVCLDKLSYGLYLLYAVYRNSEFSTKASLTYFLFGGLYLLIFIRELKKISNLKWFLSEICNWLLSWIWKRILSYIWRNPILVKNISLFVFIHISLFIFNNQYIFLEHFFYTMDSFDSYTIMYDMFDLNFTWEINFYPTPLLGHKVNANVNANTSNTGNSGNTSNTGNSGNTSNTSNTGNNGDSGSGPNGGRGPSGHSGPSGDNDNDSNRKKSKLFSNLQPKKNASNKKPSAQALKDEAIRERIRNDVISNVKSQVSQDDKYGINIDSNNHIIWGAAQAIDPNTNQYIRSDGDFLSKVGMFLNSYRTGLTTKFYRNRLGNRVSVRGRYEDIFPQNRDGETHPIILILHEYHKQVSKKYIVSSFNEQINFDYLIRLNKNITKD